MPDGRNLFRRHHVVRHYPRRVEMRAAAVGVEEAPNHEIPADTVEILPRKVKRVAPSARTQLVHVLRISHRSPYPTDARITWGTEIFGIRDVDTAHADVERMLSHVAVHCFDDLRVSVQWDTGEGFPRFWVVRDVPIRAMADRFSTKHVNLILYKSRVPALGLIPCPTFLAPRVSALRHYYLYPHLLGRLQDAHALQHFGERVYFVFFLRVLIELEFDIRADGIRIVTRLQTPIGRITILSIGVESEFRRVIFDLDHLNLGVVCVHHRFHIWPPITPCPDVKMDLSAERGHLKREIRAHLTLPDSIEKRGFSRVGPELRERIFHCT